jgi:short-subunit dehydrogenase
VTAGNGRAALVTGASSGIGAATARRLAAEGWTVGIVARRHERLAEVLDDCCVHAPRSRLWVADLSDLDAAAGVAREAWDALGGLDALVNNAGVPLRRPVTRLTLEDVERVMRVNFFSPVRMTLAVLGRMVQRGSGVVVNVSSLAGRIGVTTEAAYSASKFALAGWSEAIAADLAGTGVRVRLVLPGTIDTEIWDQPGNDAPLYRGPLTPAEDMAEAIVAAIDSERFEHYLPDMRAVVEMKAKDPDGFMEAMIETARTWKEQP